MAIESRIVGKSSEIEALREQLQRLALFDARGSAHVPTVLLLGETGTGKGLVARAMHDGGPRADGPFIDVNCAAIPEPMLEAELFGFEAGAFTDARRAKPGLFEAAGGGTLFLDEIDSLTPPVQSKVLKAIEDKQVRRLGSVTPLTVDAKLIAATQRDLEAAVASGAFRADLYHRLAVLVLRIPALRQRAGDAELLAEHFLHAFGSAHGLAPKRLTDEARSWLTRHDWPGNVRELAHLMERVTFLSVRDEIDAAALDELCIRLAPQARSAPQASASSSGAAEDEARRILSALGRTGGNVVRAARMLGLGRNALRYRMRRLGIDRPEIEAVELGEPGGAPNDAPPAAIARDAAGVPYDARGPAARAESTAPEAVAWEPKPVAVLALALTFRDGDRPDVPDFEPWTAASRWESSAVERAVGFGAAILQRSPGRLTAVFGVPRALEQTPERAVQAALAIQKAVVHGAGARPEMRAAVHVGEVRVDARARDPLAHVLPVGDVFAFPERLLGHAGAGEVLASAPAARRVERRCRLEPRPLRLGPRADDHVTAYRVAAALPVSGAPAAIEDAGVTRFVGRERELDVLGDAFARAEAGQGQVVFIAGEAGIGKSRLGAEFRRRLGVRPHRWFEGRCASYGAGTPFLPLIDGLRRYFGIDDADAESAASAKIARELERLGDGLAWTLPFVQQLLSLGNGTDAVRQLDSASRRSELFRALCALTLRTAEAEPLVAVVEDLHWIDPASEEFLALLGDLIPTTRVLLLLSHRSGYRHPFGDRSFHQRITLAPLSGSEMAAMTGAILGVADAPAELRSLIAGKAEGNPFFVEELTRSLLEEGSLQRDGERVVLARDVSEIAVPDSIQDVLIARIDRLAEESRQAIQVASVIGREFALRLLGRILKAGERVRSQVDELRQLELIYEKALHPELAYMFKHALTHDVAYESVVRERRRALHRLIGSAIEELYADRLAEHYETLAHHFGRAEEWPRALLYLERSAEKAAATHANRAVVEHCRRALEIAALPGSDVSEAVLARFYRHLGRAHFYLSEYAASGAAYEAAARGAAPSERAARLDAASGSYFWGHRYEDAWRCHASAAAAAAEADAAALRARVEVSGAFFRAVHGGDVDDLRRVASDGLAVCARAGDREVEAYAGVYFLQASEWSGRYGDSIHLAPKTIALGRELRAPEHVILATWFLGKARCCTGDFGGALSLLEEAGQLCERIGDRAWRSRILNTLGWCYSEIGSFERAREHNERGAELARAIGDPEILANASINLACNHLALGARGRALEYLEPIEAALAEPGDPWMRWRYALHALDARAALELERGEPEKALASALAELDAARRHRAPKVESRALARKAAALLALERRDEAEEALAESITIAERIGHAKGIWDARRLLAESERRAGRTEAAATHLAAARAIVERAARTLADTELRARLIAAVAG